MRFAKYHGLGNDFIVVDRRQGGAALSPERVRALCDRHTGVGADGVLSIWAEAGKHGRMQVQNADGSDSALCGNGLRCVARYLHDEGGVTEDALELVAGRGVYETRRVAPGRYAVAMGRAVFSHPELPGPSVELEVLSRTFSLRCVHLGNPHAVTLAEDPLALAEAYGAALERHPAFPARANISFVAPRGERSFDVVVFERGVGITRACGSGACASVVAMVELGRAPRDVPLEVRLLGGPLVITVRRDDSILMEGEAVFVFSGEVPE